MWLLECHKASELTADKPVYPAPTTSQSALISPTTGALEALLAHLTPPAAVNFPQDPGASWGDKQFSIFSDTCYLLIRAFMISKTLKR